MLETLHLAANRALRGQAFDAGGTEESGHAGQSRQSLANGIGLVDVTYCVGGLNVLNAIAGAYAEKSPVVVVSGAPGR